MRALWLTETWLPDRGGMPESCDRIVRGLRGRGVRIDVVHLSRRHPWLRSGERMGGLEVACPIGEDVAHDLNVLWTWLDARRQNGSAQDPWTHVVAFGGSVPMLAGPVLAAWLGAPLVTLLRGNDFDAAVFSPRGRPALEAALRASTAVCAVSRDKAERAAALWPGVEPVWVPNGIDVDAWTATPVDVERAHAWRAAHVPPGRRVLGLFGHLKAKKGVTLFLEALRRSGRADRAHLLIAGLVAPEVDAWLERHAGELSATIETERDRFELLPLYLAADVVVLPSYYDGLPNVCLEALALSTPVLGSTAGGLRDVLEDGAGGLLFPAGDVEGCRDALERALTMEAGELAAVGAAGRRRVATAFAADAEIDGYMKVLNRG